MSTKKTNGRKTTTMRVAVTRQVTGGKVEYRLELKNGVLVEA